MKISFNWLKTLVNTDLSADTCAEMLTSSGLEVESVEQSESVRGGLRGLVIGEVMSCEKHPDADRLSLTKVDIGSGNLLSIVCGAPNVAAGQKVVVATTGTTLYPVTGEPFEIKKSKIRGAVSEGMICAEDEIGLGMSHAGIMVLPEGTRTGMPASEFFKVETDTIFEIGLTPNRSDAASHLGVARDLAAIINSRGGSSKVQVNMPGLKELPPSTNTVAVDILLESAECKRYSGLVISGVKVSESPAWLKNRLMAIGVRPINNIVDATNFVLHELGQPLHAFDAEKLSGRKIIVRNARQGEKFVTLDGVERTLHENDLMVCDSEKPVCIAGVFGGSESGVSESTSIIFIESAWFDAGAVRRTASHHGLKTDASFRFERGTDPEMTVTALNRCANLILEIAGGNIAMPVRDLYAEKAEPFKVAFSFSNCHELIGKEIDRSMILNIIRNLGIQVEQEGNDGLLLSVPRFKSDVTREADVIEEVMRIYGYNNVEVSRQISYSAVNVPENLDLLLENRIAGQLTGSGFNEMMGLSLSSEKYYQGNEQVVHLVNPLSSDLAVLRQNMLFNGLEALAHNINRRNADLRLFEFGKTYTRSDDGYLEQRKLGIYVTGRIFPLNPYYLDQEASLPYLRAVVETVLQKCGLSDLRYEETSSGDLAFGLDCVVKKKKLARLGAVSKQVLKKMEVQQEVFFAEIDLNALRDLFRQNSTRYQELSKFPAVKRDLALLIGRNTRFSEIMDLAYATEKKLLREVTLFDVYEGEKLGDKKSYAVSFTLMDHEATLTDKQIEAVMEKLIRTYKEKLGAELR